MSKGRPQINSHEHDSERMTDIAILDHVFSEAHQIPTNPDYTSAAYARRWHDQQHAEGSQR